MLKTAARAIIALMLMASISACYSVRVYRPDVTPAPIEHVKLQHTFIYGIVSLGSVNAGAMCGEAPIYSVHSRLGGIGLIVNTLTVGLWSPMTVKVTCGVPKAAAGGMTDAGTSLSPTAGL